MKSGILKLTFRAAYGAPASFAWLEILGDKAFRWTPVPTAML